MHSQNLIRIVIIKVFCIIYATKLLTNGFLKCIKCYKPIEKDKLTILFDHHI